MQNGNDISYVAQQITFGARNYTNANEPQGFLPIIKQAEITEPSYQRLTGVAQTVAVSLEDDNNKGHVFAKIPDQASSQFCRPE
ncbi:MAG: hypothetical protein IPF69_18000 [Chitinophagaceae bacterium]|nr:hypothetical protein [Chitinophagaceae bacterium]